MISNNSLNIYDYENNQLDIMANNRLFCTFSILPNIDSLISEISSLYTIMYNKMFVLMIKDSGEYAITYNVEQGNTNSIPDNTVLVHRKKISNTLYSLNALNELIKTLNDGHLDSSYNINWENYRNTILLTQQGELKKLNTKIYKIIEL